MPLKANTTQPAMDPSVPSSSGQPPPTTQSNPGGSRSNPQRPPTQRPKNNNTRRPPKNNSNQPRPNNTNPRFEKKERNDADQAPQNNNSQQKRNPQPKRNPNNPNPNKRRPVNPNQPNNVSADQPVAVQPWAEQQTTAKPKKFANLSDMGSGAPKKMRHDNRPQVDLKEEDVQKKYEGYSEMSGKIIRELLNNNYECMVCCEGKATLKSFFSIF